MSALMLPSKIADTLAKLRRRIVRTRLIRGLSLFVALACLGFGLIFLLDAFLDFTTRGLQIAFGSWALACLGLAGHQLFLPWWRQPDSTALAALIESKHPELQEVLSTAVALSRHRDQANGAEDLIALLNQQAETRCANFDPRLLYPMKLRFLGWMVVAVVIVIGSTLLANAGPRFAHRFFAAWFDPWIGFNVVVEPGHQTLPLGSQVVVTAQFTPKEKGVRLPHSCFVVFQSQDGTPRKLRMAPTGDHSFQIALERLSGDLTYHLESADYRSDDFQVRAIQPVEVTEEIAQFIPPSYVNPDIHRTLQFSTYPRIFRLGNDGYDTLPNPGSSQPALQFGRLRYSWRFTRPPVQVQVRKLTLDQGNTGETLLPLTWSEDRLEAGLDVPLNEPGTFCLRLTMMAEANFQTRLVTKPCLVVVDKPPEFSGNIQGIPQQVPSEAPFPRARADEKLRLRVAVADAVGLDRLEVEIRVNHGPTKVIALAAGQGRLTIDGEFPFRFPDNLQEGDLVEMRLKATDNRKVNLPGVQLAPQTTFEPARREGKDHWLAFQIAPQADPLAKQEITGLRDALILELAKLDKQIAAEQALVKAIKLGGHAQNFLPAPARELLNQALGKNETIGKELARFATKAAPAAPDLSDMALDLAEGEMARAMNQLRLVEAKQREPQVRDQALDQADRELAQALKKLGALKEGAARLAQNRLDQLDLQRLADLEEELAGKAEGLVDKELAMDPRAQTEMAKLQNDQDRIAAGLEKLTQRSQQLKEARRLRQKNQAKDLAQQARKLAGMQLEQDQNKDIRLETAKLADDLGQLAQKGKDDQAMDGVKEAAQAAAEAKALMDQGKKAETTEQAKALAQEAGLKLMQAAKKAEEAAGIKPGQAKSDEAALAGQALDRADQAMREAYQQLREKKPGQAAQAMNQAAKALNQASQQANKKWNQATSQTGAGGKQPNPQGELGGGNSTKLFLGDLGKFAGKSWGQLPGEVRNRIVQDLSSRYGPEFADLVRGYFEQIADVPLNQ